ncbi:MAG: NAD-dependent epimerase/dehydratase family protein [Flavobacteriaceae bacterium]|nr:NAD-dependent epimerase/dehydratase family protein [Flavobacteriaceae bacterium]
MILITGGTGLVGAHLLYRLSSEGCKLRAIRRKSSDVSAVENVFRYYSSNYKDLFSSIEWVEADICDIPSLEEAFEGIKQVYHCAAAVSFDTAKAEQIKETNKTGTANIVNLCIDFKIEKLCFVSSIAAVGSGLGDKKIDENSQWDSSEKNSDYAMSKYAAEMEVWRGGQEGVPVVIVNPGVIVGPGFWKSGIGGMFSRVYNDFPFYSVGSTGYIGVKDVVSSMVLLMNSDIINERFILVSENISHKKVLQYIAKSFKAKKVFIKIGNRTGGILWRLNYLMSLITKHPQVITKFSIKGANSVSFYDNNKIKNAVNIELEPINRSIEETCAYYCYDL